MERSIIHSRQNPLVKSLSRLKSRKDREQRQRFLVEGLRELRQALRNEVWIESLVVCPPHFKSEQHGELLRQAEAEDVEIHELAPGAFEKISTREGPDGIIGVAVQRDFLLEGAKLPDNPLLLVVERVEKPGNLGAILRTADAAGVDCVICCDPVTDLYNPNVIRSSQGLVFALPVFLASWDRCREFLRQTGIRSFATSPAAPVGLWETDLTGPVALLLGSEKDGLSGEALKLADETVSIPMLGAADSLNLSVSAAVVLFEALRQRQITPATP